MPKAKTPNKNKPEMFVSDGGYSYTLYPAESHSTYLMREETIHATMVKKTRDTWIVKSPHTLETMGLLHQWSDGEWTTQPYRSGDVFGASLYSGGTPSEALEKLGSGLRKYGVWGGKRRHSKPRAGGKKRHAATENGVYDRLKRIPEGSYRNIGGWRVYNRGGEAVAIYDPANREGPQQFFYTKGEAARWLLSHSHRRHTTTSLAAQAKVLRSAMRK